jgi:hypothetical protein
VFAIFLTGPRRVFAIKIPEREFGAKRMSLRWEVRDGEEQCQFRRNNFKDENDFGPAGRGAFDGQLPIYKISLSVEFHSMF